MADLIKKGDLEFVAQLNTFSEKIADYAALFGLSAAQLDAIAADANWMNYVVQRNSGVPGFAQDWTRLKNQSRFGGDGNSIPQFPSPPNVSTPPTVVPPPNIEGRFRKLVGQLKANDKYSKAIGENLGIHADDTSFDRENYKPKGVAKAVLTDVTIKFKKYGAEGMAIYSRVTVGTAKQTATEDTSTPAPMTAAEINEFKKIGVASYSPYVDDRPLAVAGQAETREYYLRGIVHDDEIGVPSDVIKVAVGAW